MMFSFEIISQIICAFWLNWSLQNLKLAEYQPISDEPVEFYVRYVFIQKSLLYWSQ